MQRNEALTLVKQHLKNRNLVKHCLAVEACMWAMAERQGEDTEIWAMAGLLHDLDYEKTDKNPETHALETVKMLQDADLDPRIPHAILAHAGRVACESPMDWSIYAIDPLTGLIIAATLMHPSRKLAEVDTAFVLRRYKEKHFARGAKREDIEQISHIGMDLDDFVTLCLGAMQGISGDLGL